MPNLWPSVSDLDGAGVRVASSSRPLPDSRARENRCSRLCRLRARLLGDTQVPMLIRERYGGNARSLNQSAVLVPRRYLPESKAPPALSEIGWAMYVRSEFSSTLSWR